MAGPWEQYQSVEQGPWTQYSAPAQSDAPQGVGGSVMDAIKGIPRSLLSGVMDAATAGAQAEAHAMSQPDLAAQIPNTDEAVKAMAGDLYSPQTTLGKIVGAGARTLTNPASYVGPGSLPLKIGANALSGMGSEAAGEAAQGTPLEGAARLGGSLVGAVAGAKALGPAVESAAVPTLAELRASADRGYSAARNSDLVLKPKGIADFAANVEQELTNGPKYGFTGGENGTAKKTLDLLDKLQSAPDGATVTAANLDTLRKNIGNLAGETREFKPTPDAKAAMVLKQRYADYLENLPQDHVVAGDPASYVSAIKQANGDYAAASRLGNFDARTTKAENQTNRQIAGSLDARIKANVGSVLDNPKKLRGLTPDEIAQIQLINNGSPVSNTLRQLGRGGAGVIPMATHIATAYGTGGASIPFSLGVGVPLYAARKTAERMTVNRANDLADMLAKRSPLYQSRAPLVPPMDRSPYTAAIARALLQVR